MGTERCRCCRREAETRDHDFVELADGSMICGACALQVRILYPKSFTWVNIHYSSDIDDAYYSDEDTRWIDPLSAITFEAFQDALKSGLPGERATARVRHISMWTRSAA